MSQLKRLLPQLRRLHAECLATRMHKREVRSHVLHSIEHTSPSSGSQTEAQRSHKPPWRRTPCVGLPGEVPRRSATRFPRFPKHIPPGEVPPDSPDSPSTFPPARDEGGLSQKSLQGWTAFFRLHRYE